MFQRNCSRAPTDPSRPYDRTAVLRPPHTAVLGVPGERTGTEAWKVALPGWQIPSLPVYRSSTWYWDALFWVVSGQP